MKRNDSGKGERIPRDEEGRGSRCVNIPQWDEVTPQGSACVPVEGDMRWWIASGHSIGKRILSYAAETLPR